MFIYSFFYHYLLEIYFQKTARQDMVRVREAGGELGRRLIKACHILRVKVFLIWSSEGSGKAGSEGIYNNKCKFFKKIYLLWNILLLLKSLVTYLRLFSPSFRSSFTGPLKFCKPISHASKFALAITLTYNALPKTPAWLTHFLHIDTHYYLSIRFSLVTTCRWPYYYSHSASNFSSAFIIIWHSKDLLTYFVFNLPLWEFKLQDVGDFV